MNKGLVKVIHRHDYCFSDWITVGGFWVYRWNNVMPSLDTWWRSKRLNQWIIFLMFLCCCIFCNFILQLSAFVDGWIYSCAQDYHLLVVPFWLRSMLCLCKIILLFSRQLVFAKLYLANNFSVRLLYFFFLTNIWKEQVQFTCTLNFKLT